MSNCTNTEYILRELNTRGSSTIAEITKSFSHDCRQISNTEINRILSRLNKLQIVDYYGLKGTKALTWETNNIWEHYMSESRKQDLMGYTKLPELVRLSIDDNYIQPNMLVKYNDNLYKIANFNKNQVRYDRSELDQTTMQPLPHVTIQTNTTLILQLLSLKDENKVRHDRDIEIYKLPNTN